MEIVGGSGLLVGSSVKRKRSIVSRKPRANSDTLFQSFFSFPSPFVEPLGKHDENENENLRNTKGPSDGLGAENKLKKLKLKFGGVTHTIHTNSKEELAFSSDPFVTNFYPCSDGSKLEVV
ncbi:hypothetical protein L6164_013656 [Bauhinia variegata]|uniref:Uncharacterized protein n=1 Tax=Bauhinia variegata TaxID=167791 RepID=A0ACB9NG49_BAUVA|nr:hypothetical protein L6164_013656 [Bauhinia variegata]